MPFDKLGMDFTAALPETAAAFNSAMDDYMLFTGEPVGRLLAAAEVDPDFAMGYCLTGCLRLFGGVSAAHPRVNLELRAAKARRPRVSEREQAHIDAFDCAAGGEMAKAGGMWDAILKEHPHDMMAAKCAHEAYYLVGESERMRDSVLAILPHWTEQMDYYGYLLGMGAFGLEESGDYREAERMGRRAVEIEPRDVWGVHAVAHVLQMEERCGEGIAWLDGTVGDWAEAKWLRGHLWWHLTLPLIETGQTERVLDIYDAHISDCDKDMVTRLNDCSSCLWRLELAGVDVGDRWDALVDMWVHHTDEHAFAFADAHLAMTLVSAGGEKKLSRFLESVNAYVEGADHANSRIIESVGRDLCLGLIAYRRGEYDRAVALMDPIKDDIWRIGGSNAQRDVFRQTLDAARTRAAA
jgi:tetratricopeptide (TPR) repeat protein